MGEVTFEPGEIFALSRSTFATRTKVKAMQPFGLLELGEQDLEDYIRRLVPLVGDIRVKGSGIEIRFLEMGVDPAEAEQPREDQLTKPARYLPRVEGGRLKLDLISVSQIGFGYRADAARIEDIIRLPKIPAGLRPDVGLRDRVVVVEAQGLEVSLTVGEGEP